ncbi:chalcone isomerase family protein [Marinicella meishanensis]|uniref:chalcone isomerase family protein n=1 Tax=Marinicella meishanensis TaxID=2873263 RepID=UPI001CBC8F79|nr:chalcone isomerase family protein [Marinicella sp. NBU2979]
MKLIMLLIIGLTGINTHPEQWVKVGESEISWGYKTPYRINLRAPKGVHDIDDIRNGVQDIQFDLEWLAPVTTQEQVTAHFKELLENQLKDPESIKFNRVIIDRLLNKLPAANRFDHWQFYFSPDSGTAVYINGEKVHNIIGSEINRALHAAWLFRDPVTTSKLLTRLLKLGQ